MKNNRIYEQQKFFCVEPPIKLTTDDFNESDHPRAENGQFSSKGGGGSPGGGKQEQIESLKAQLAKTSRFGSGAAKRAELQKQIEELEGKSQEPKPVKQPKPKSNPAKEYQRPERNYPVTPQKEKQFDIIQKTNPMHDEQHTGIRKPSDIMSPEEAFRTDVGEGYSYPDFSKQDGEKALKSGKIKVYSSHPIKNGGFISPSRMMANEYAGGGKVYELEVPVDSVAWINSDEGQLADTRNVRDSMNRTMYKALMRSKAKGR